MGQKQSGAAEAPPTSPRDVFKRQAKTAGGIASAKHGKDVHDIRAWSRAIFSSKTSFLHEKDDEAYITANDFKDPLVSLLFQFIMSKGTYNKEPITKSHYVHAITAISRFNNDEMIDFVIDALLFMFNRNNRLNPKQVDAATIRSVLHIISDDYNLGLELNQDEIAHFFEVNTGKRTGAVSRSQFKNAIKSSMNSEDLKIINKSTIFLRPPHLHPSPRDKGWVDCVNGHDSGTDTESSSGSDEDESSDVSTPSTKESKETKELKEGGKSEEEDVDTVKKKVIIMKKIRDKKMLLQNTFDPEEKKKINDEVKLLTKRLQAIGNENSNFQSVSKKPPPPAAAAAIVEINENDEETYTMSVHSGPIGLVLASRDDNTNGAKVTKISNDSQASKVQDLTVGDILIKIGNIDVRSKPLVEIMSLLKTTDRPFMLTLKMGDDDSD
jgi:hypothetical protein